VVVVTLSIAGKMISSRLAPSSASGSTLQTASGAAPAPDTEGERLPCGHRLANAGKDGETITATCVKGHFWGYSQGRWDNSLNYSGATDLSIPPPKMPTPEDLLPCGHRVQGSTKHGERFEAECVQGHNFATVNGRWEKR
jgi:hypothetical protein